jgi:hypothetical protein
MFYICKKNYKYINNNFKNKITGYNTRRGIVSHLRQGQDGRLPTAGPVM